ncbi:hypothetical protein [Kribbella sp. NPDC048928]
MQHEARSDGGERFGTAAARDAGVPDRRACAGVPDRRQATACRVVREVSR